MSKLILYDFSATWCGPCQMQKPIIEALAVKYKGKVDVKMVDIDANQELADKYSLSVVPTLIFEVDGKVVHRIEGLTEKEVLESLIEKFA